VELHHIGGKIHEMIGECQASIHGGVSTKCNILGRIDIFSCLAGRQFFLDNCAFIYVGENVDTFDLKASYVHLWKAGIHFMDENDITLASPSKSKFVHVAPVPDIDTKKVEEAKERYLKRKKLKSEENKN